jgi:two-component system, cell cycle response regulator
MPNVLVIDDSATMRTVLTEMLEEHGWTVECFADAEAGASRALSKHTDAIVADLWLPGLSGLQLCRALRDIQATRDLPILLLTASGDRRSRFWAEESGATGYLEKRAVKQLPGVLAKITERSRPPRQMGAAVSGKTLAARLSNLLDGALFESVLSSKLRGLALQQSTLEGMFQGLAELMSTVVAYRWLSLGIRGADETYCMVHAHPMDMSAGEEALASMGFPAGPKPTMVLGEQCVLGKGGEEGGVQIRPLRHADATVGWLGIDLGAGARSSDLDAFELAVRELVLPVRLLSVLESTQRLALTDQLTALPNRRAGIDALERAVSEASRHGAPLSVAMVDIDHFKRINDLHGHAVGDATLSHVASTLRRSARRSDTVARWGGEEFLVVLPSTSPAQALVACDRLRACVMLSPLSTPLDVKVEPSVSIGVATWNHETAADFIGRADRALYAAKEAGRNCVRAAPQPRLTALRSA